LVKSVNFLQSDRQKHSLRTAYSLINYSLIKLAYIVPTLAVYTRFVYPNNGTLYDE